MELKINKISLEILVNQLQSFLEKKDFSQITSCIFFEAKENKLIAKATDYEIGISMSISNIDIIKEGTVAFSGKKIFDIVKNFQEDDIIIKLVENQAIIKQNKTVFKLPSMISEEFPYFPNKENKKILSIKDFDISNVLKVINCSIDNNNAKYELNGMLLDIKENDISFMSTDTKRLTISKIKNDNKEEIHRIIIPKKTVNEIIKLFSKDINLFFDKTYLVIEKNNVYFYSKLINGKYPDFEKMIPEEYKHKVILNKKTFMDSINIIQPISMNIKMIFRENKIFFENLDNINIEAKTELELENVNFENDIVIPINGKYILDFIHNIEYDSLIFKFTDSEKPIEIEANNIKTVIMTIKEFN